MKAVLGVCLAALLSFPAVASDWLSARTIVGRAFENAGGDTWVRPETLVMKGSATFFDGPKQLVNERHEMWRVYSASKTDTHRADGKVRIRSMRGDAVVFDVAFDGVHTTSNGVRTEEPADSRRWAANFGFGAIRHALDDGYALKRLPDDSVDGREAYFIELTDPSGRATQFAIASDNYDVLLVGFETPRGWHTRIYSDFFRKPGVDWQQPGRVRLFYNGVKQNEVRWTQFDINTAIDDSVFTPVVENTREEAVTKDATSP